MSLTTTLSGWYEESLNLNFCMFCAIIKPNKRMVLLVVTLPQNSCEKRSCGKSPMMGRLHQTSIQTAD